LNSEEWKDDSFKHEIDSICSIEGRKPLTADRLGMLEKSQWKRVSEVCGHTKLTDSEISPFKVIKGACNDSC